MGQCYTERDFKDFVEYRIAYIDELKMHAHLLHCESCRKQLKEIYIDLKKSEVYCG